MALTTLDQRDSSNWSISRSDYFPIQDQNSGDHQDEHPSTSGEAERIIPWGIAEHICKLRQWTHDICAIVDWKYVSQEVDKIIEIVEIMENKLTQAEHTNSLTTDSSFVQILSDKVMSSKCVYCVVKYACTHAL
jgi:hypothetical protein